MKAFLSHSSKDKWFVRPVFEQLGETQAEYDEQTFEYTFNVRSIRSALDRSDLFVYFLSKNSISSSFVDDEQKTALEKRGRGFIKKVVIFALDDTAYSQAPEWMRDINIVQRLSSSKACGRRIQSMLWAMSADEDRSEDLYLGRDADRSAIRKAIAKPSDQTPIAFHAVGYHGIGRRTFIRKSIQEFLPRICDVFTEVTIGQFDGLDELYRNLYDQHFASSREQIIADLKKFSLKSTEEKEIELADIILEMNSNKEFIIFMDDGGVYDEEGNYQSHIRHILERIAYRGRPIVAFIQTRMMPYLKKEQYPRSFHHYLKVIDEDSTRELLILKLKYKDIDFTSEQIDIICNHLDGHPFNVKFAVGLIAHFGIEQIARDPGLLIEWKTRRAEEFLKRIEFSELETEILAILSEYVFVSTDAIYGLVIKDQKNTSTALRTLEEFCCIERREGYFHISAPIRDAVRRDARFDRNEDWKKTLANKFIAELEQYQDSDQIQISLIQNSTRVAALGIDTPDYVSLLILPSHFLKIARDHYDAGKRKLCIEFCKKAFQARDRLTTNAQIELLRLWGLSAVRNDDTDEYNSVIKQLKGFSEKVAVRHAHFIEGFKNRIRGRLDDAETSFRKAWQLSRRNPSINRELAVLYCKQKLYSDAEAHAKIAYEFQPVNAYVLDIMAEVLLGKQEAGLGVDVNELNKVISDLEEYGDTPGVSFFQVRKAQQLMKERKYPDALKAIDVAIGRNDKLLPPLFMKAEICLAMADVGGAENVRKRISELLNLSGAFVKEDEGKMEEIQIRIWIQSGSFKSAKESITKAAFIHSRAKFRLYELLKRAIVAFPREASSDLLAWANTPSDAVQAQRKSKGGKIRRGTS